MMVPEFLMVCIYWADWTLVALCTFISRSHSVTLYLNFFWTTWEGWICLGSKYICFIVLLTLHCLLVLSTLGDQSRSSLITESSSSILSAFPTSTDLTLSLQSRQTYQSLANHHNTQSHSHHRYLSSSSILSSNAPLSIIRWSTS